MMRRIVCLTLFTLSGCFQVTGDDGDFRTVPVTNNPYVVPTHGGMLPGMSTSGAGGPH